MPLGPPLRRKHPRPRGRRRRRPAHRPDAGLQRFRHVARWKSRRRRTGLIGRGEPLRRTDTKICPLVTPNPHPRCHEIHRRIPRSRAAARRLAEAIDRATTRPWNIMEICGGQTHAIIRFGLDEMLPPEITLIHGPGCPVCVTPIEILDKAVAIAARPEVIFCSFGDMLRVPGSQKDLFTVKSEGGDVRVVYSPMDAVALAQKHPERRSGLLRRRFRDHRAGQRDGRRPGRPAGAEELLGAGLARARAAGHAGGALLAAEPRAGLSGRRPRLHDHRHGRVSAAGREVPRADRRHRLRAARYSPGRADVRASNWKRAGTRSRTNTPASVRPEGNPAGDAADRRSLRGRAAEVAGHRRDSRPAAWGCASRMPRSMPSGVSTSSRSRPRNRPSASPAKCCKATRSRTIARPSASTARPNVRWARRWFPPKGPARRIIGIGGRRNGEVADDELRSCIDRFSSRHDLHTECRRFQLSCPLPLGDHATVQMAHGGGGRLMRQLIEGLFLPAFSASRTPRTLAPPHDSAVLEIGGARLAFTTDTFVVSPLFFPGGDIGKLAVCGTVNDLAMAGREAAVSQRRLHPRRRACRWRRCAASSASMADGRASGRRADRHRRHQGRRSRQGRRHLHQHGRHRPGAQGIDISPAPGRAGRCDPRERRPRPARHGHHVGPRRAAASRATCRAIAHSLAGLVEAMLAAGGRHPLPPRPDPRRTGRRAQRNRPATPRWASSSTKRRFPWPSRWPRPAKCWASTRSTWPTKAGWWPSSPAEAADEVLKIMRRHPAAVGPAIIGRVTADHAGTVELRRPSSAAAGSSICSPASRCRGFASLAMPTIYGKIVLTRFSPFSLIVKH